ncbi:hypothetical protein Gohar_017372 [Gossypium harknessii]|uniref:DUF4283 domain-containing protein n=1 Tax=Gossypium harknessii TaxID=34285 RepID=A0A7J9G6F6_9ROSI|nr:hypothetical protein [Gossypium harknessii]
MALVSGASWKDKLLGGKSSRYLVSSMNPSETFDGDFDFEDGDILRSTVYGIPAIGFSDRIKKILVKDMETTVVPFRLMDVEMNATWFVFKTDDYEMVLTQGPWVVFGHYLTVQPWTVDFNPLRPFPSVVLA